MPAQRSRPSAEVRENQVGEQRLAPRRAREPVELEFVQEPYRSRIRREAKRQGGVESIAVGGEAILVRYISGASAVYGG